MFTAFCFVLSYHQIELDCSVRMKTVYNHFSIVVAILWQQLATDLKRYTLRSFPTAVSIFYWWKIFGCMVGLYWILSLKCGTMLTNDLEFIWFRAARIIQTWPKWIWFGDDICICGFPVWKIKQQIGDIYNIVHQNRIEPLKQTA